MLSLTGAAQASAPRGDWSTWGNSTARNGIATLSKVNAAKATKLALAWSRPLDAVVTAQPLFIADPRGGEYITATAAGTLSAFAAKNGGCAGTPRSARRRRTARSCRRGIFGITGTPVYDRSTDTIYAVDATASSTA